MVVQLSMGGPEQSAQVHRLVAEAFLPPSNAPLVRHLDGNPLNNYADNLAWGTQYDNMQDALRHGTRTCGTRMNTAKLTDNEVREIRAAPRNMTLTELAQKYGVAVSTIHRVRHRQAWRHVE